MTWRYLVPVWLLMLVLPALAFAQDGAATGGTTQWITLAIALLAGVVALLREVAPKTPNTYDDEALAFLSGLDMDQLHHLQAMLDPSSRVKTGPTPARPDGR